MDLLKYFEQLSQGENDEKKRQYKKSPLNIIGSKRETLPQILDLLPYTNTFVDVFGGSGTVILSRNPCKLDVYNDRMSGACDFFRAIRDDPERLISQIELMPHSRELFQRFVTDSHNDYIARGAIFYYLIQCSFGGRGQFFGRVTQSKNTIIQKLYKNLEMFPAIHQRFKQITIENLDWKMCITDFDDYDTVFYCDPPYIDSNVYEHNISHQELCDTIFKCKGFVALSGYENDLYNSFPWSGKHVFDVTNRITSDLTDRSAIRLECLWIKEGE